MKDLIRQKIQNLEPQQVAVWTVLGIIMLPFLVYGLPQIIGAQDALVVLSGSMEPAIPTGSMIVIYSVNPANLQEGDIVTYESGQNPRTDEPEYTTHRVIEVVTEDGERRFRTEGDNNSGPDPGTVGPDEIAGKHAFTVPYMGYILDKLGTRQGFIALVIIPGILIVLQELWKVRQEVSELKQKNKDGELIQTILIAFSGLFLIASIAYFTGAGESLLSDIGASLQLGPTTFGIGVMAAIILSLIVIRFI